QLAAEGDLDHLLQLILSTAKDLVGAEGASILLVDPATHLLEFKLSLGPESESLKDVRLKPGEGVAGSVVQSGQAAWVQYVEQEPRLCSKADAKTGFRTRSLIAVPIQDPDRTIGVLEVLNPIKGNRFNQEDLELMISLGAQAAIAIRNARFVATIRE